MSIIGHEALQKNMIQAINCNKLSHAHIIAGVDGIGKSVLVKFIASRIIGLDEAREHVDICHWTLDKGKASIGVNTIRSITEECNKKPFEGDKKVIIIYNGDKITFQAQNAFLKTIEEPPNNVYIFILCEELNSILDTIKSRCSIHKLRPLSDEAMEYFLKKNYPNLSEERISVAIALGKGIPGRAEDLLINDEFEVMRDNIFTIINNIKIGDKASALNHEKIFNDYNYLADEIFDVFITIIRDIIVFKEVGDKGLLINIDKYEEIKDLANVFSLGKLNDMIKIIEETRKSIKSNVNSSLAFITMVLRMQEV